MVDHSLPKTHYVTTDDVSIAYQILGNGPIDIVCVPGVISHLEFLHEFPGYTSSLLRLAKFARVVTFDKRGQGLSDRMVGAPSLEQRMDDVRAIMDEIGSKSAVLFGFSEGCPMSVLFAATYPERVSHLVLYGGFARAADLFLPNITREGLEALIAQRVKTWGDGEMVKLVFPSQAHDQDAVAQMAKLERLAISPGAMRTNRFLNSQIDVTSILPSVRVPTLVLHRWRDAVVPVALGSSLSAQIPGARYIEYPDGDHAFWTGDAETLLGDVEEFVTGRRDSGAAETERVLATIMFTDVVDSTGRAAAMGDQRWRGLLDKHDHLARQTIVNHRGSLVRNTGDGVLATFDGPGRAVRCALALSSAARKIGLPLRAGLHTGEIELRGQDIGGIAVHAAARVMSQADSDEVLVSRVVTDLVAGAGLSFSERGSYELKGLPGRWDLFAAAG